MSVDRAELEALIRDLGAIPPDVEREMGPAVREAAEPVLSQMRSNADWSTRIPGAISVSPGFGASISGVTFRVNARRAPHARPYENGGAAGTFRHPVYGHGDRETWTWRPQAARPFFYRAVQEKADEVVNSIADVVTEVAQRHGF